MSQDSAVIKKLHDSIWMVLKTKQTDTDRAKTLLNLALYYPNDSAVLLCDEAIALCEKNNFLTGEAAARNYLGNYYWNISNFTGALDQYMQSLRIAEQMNNKLWECSVYGNIGNTYFSLGNFRKALDYSRQAAALDISTGLSRWLGFDLSTISKAYLQLNMPDSALYFGKLAIDSSTKSGNDFLIALSLQALGDIFSRQNETQKSINYYEEGIVHAQKLGFFLGASSMMTSIAGLYYKTGQKDSAIYYAKKALQVATPKKVISVIAQAAGLLHNIYKPSDEHQSTQYLEMAAAANDSLFSNKKTNDLQNIAYNEEARQKDKEATEQRYKSNLKLYGLIVVAFIIGIIALIQLRNNNQKKKTNLLLERQKQKVEITLSELRSTQSQLIQSEKMASLGELTAGIAHEIQNPLNFVNNFSEVNKEMLEELKAERLKPNAERDEQLQDEIINDLADNSEKINHHGKRADAIVKGMLQHSRQSSGKKNPTDINALCDEYLRLSYHGLRAKNKDFNATMKTDFDNSIGKINIIPQDIGRVLLNLYNNAFYAVTEKKKSADELYQPTVSVSTKKLDNKITIAVKDNGNGIPQKVVDKIFQPFFTTKPTGQGTGLGLSLSYDIVKAHGGEIKVETKEGEGTEFIIQL